jgi:hypothetical protein
MVLKFAFRESLHTGMRAPTQRARNLPAGTDGTDPGGDSDAEQFLVQTVAGSLHGYEAKSQLRAPYPLGHFVDGTEGRSSSSENDAAALLAWLLLVGAYHKRIKSRFRRA